MFCRSHTSAARSRGLLEGERTPANRAGQTDGSAKQPSRAQFLGSCATTPIVPSAHLLAASSTRASAPPLCEQSRLERAA